MQSYTARVSMLMCYVLYPYLTNIVEINSNCFVYMFRDVQTDSGLPSAEFDSSVTLSGSTPMSSATQQPITIDLSELSRDLVSHLPSMRATYLEFAPVSTLTQFQSRCVLFLLGCIFCLYYPVLAAF